MPINHGGPAFPAKQTNNSAHDTECFFDDGVIPAGSSAEYAGMSLREYIATHALTGLLQNSQYPASEVAKSAVSFADALIAELKTKKED